MKQTKVTLTAILILILYCTVASAETDVSRVSYNDINNESVVSNNVDKLSIDICNLYKNTILINTFIKSIVQINNSSTFH